MILSEAEVRYYTNAYTLSKDDIADLVKSHEELRRERDEAAMFIRRLCVSGCANHVVKQANDWLRCKLLHSSIRDKGAAL